MPKLPNKEFRAMVPLLREKEFYEPEEHRKISWPEYNFSQIEDAYETLAFIRDSVNQTQYLPTLGKTGRPLTDPKTLAKSVLLCESLGLTERSAQGWLKIVGPFLGIYEQLDDRTIGEAYDKPEVVYILKQVFENSKTSNGVLCGDGTGLETSRKQNYESDKKAGAYLTSIVDTREVVQAFSFNGEQECIEMHSLIEQVQGDSLRLDAGFVDRELATKIRQRGMKPFIFPKKDLNLNGDLAWKLMYLELYYQVQEWLKEYHLRSHSESFHSGFKRTNRILLKENPIAQLVQVTARIIVHNRRRQAYFDLQAS